MDQEAMQKKFMEYQMLDQRVKQFHEQIQMADQQMVEIAATIASLEEFSALEEGTEILVPINNGIFAKASLKKEDKLRVNVGSSIVVDKTFDQAKELIENQKKEIEKVRTQLTANIEVLMKRASELEKELKVI
ncbi:prefoldin subunit alpha [Candidatus Woesearchaeota archaeon]|nr:prefoldin subunit alpha [Candidatus Woesearchaeota archaeon]